MQEGRRCCCDEFFATVRFVGEVPPSKGVWVGVEWDDPSRGKHDGIKEGVRYFTCSHPTSGSFVRPAKLAFGRTFCEVIKARYGSKEYQSMSDSTKLEVGFNFLGGAKISTEIQSHFDQLENVHLSRMLISSAGPSGDILRMCPNIVELDLSGNLLSSWREVADITIQLPHLVSLNVSDNRLVLSAAGDGREELVEAFSSIQSLYVIRMDLQLHQLLDIVELMTSLRHLHACENEITGLRSSSAEGGERAASVFSALESLNLEENQLSDWSDVLVLRQLKELRTLILNDNQLTDIHFPADEIVFPALRSLSLYRNRIKSWSSVCALGSLCALTELKFKDNPVLQGGSELIGRQLTIAYLHRLIRLNASEVTDKERTIAEHYYLRRFAADYVKASSGDQSGLAVFSKDHPRFTHLVKLHGLPEENLWSKPQTDSSGVLKNSLLSLKLVFPEDTSKPQLTKKLPDTMTIQKLKVLLQHFYKVDVSDQSLSYISGEDKFEVELCDNLKQLSFYAIKSGDTVVLKRR